MKVSVATRYLFTAPRFIATLVTAYLLTAYLPSSAIASSHEDSAASSSAMDNKPFTVIAHRGASGYLPEHTLEAATLAFSLNADFIEQDVVITKDDVPIVLHDIHLETVTNVEEIFADRARKDGRYYARDFTLTELRMLRVHEREDKQQKPVFAKRFSASAPQFSIATLYEHLELIGELNRQFGKSVGVYPEVKSPSFHLAEGVDASKIVIEALKKYKFDGASDNSYLQCFDFNEIKRIRNELGYKGKVVMLIGENSWRESETDYNWIRSAEGMAKVAEYADGIGPWLNQLFDAQTYDERSVNKQPLHKNQSTIKAAGWVSEAHKQGLIIHPYTYRQDALPPGLSGEQLLNALKTEVKVDGIFTDHIPPVTKWRADYLNLSALHSARLRLR